MNIQILLVIIYFIGLIQGASRKYILNPKEISALNIKSLMNDISYSFSVTNDEQYVYLAAGQGGVHIIDISNKQQPNLVWTVESNFTMSCNIKNNYLFIADLQEGFLIYNVEKKQAPTKIAQLNFIATFQYVLVTSDAKFAFLLANGAVFSVDISDITKPTVVSSFTQILAPNSYRLRFDPNEEYLIVSNHISGVQILDIRNRFGIKLRASLNPSFVTWDAIVTPDGQGIYLADAYFGLYFSSLKGMNQIPQSSDNKYNLNFINLQGAPSLLESIAMTKDGGFIILGFRSIGLKLFQIMDGDYSQLQFVQHIEGSFFSQDIYLSKNSEKYVIVSNGISLVIYSSVTENLNQDFPNIFNTFQSGLVPKISPINPYHNYCFPNGKYYAESNPAYGVVIMSQTDRYTLTRLSYLPFQGDLISGIDADSSQNFLFVAMSQLGLHIFNLQNLENASVPNEVSVYIPKVYIDPTQPPLKNQIIAVSLSSDSTLAVIANGFAGVVVVDVTNPSSPQDGGYYSVPHGCGFEKCIWMKDSIRIICTCRELGVYFFTYSKKSKTFALNNVVFSVGTEALILSKNESMLYVANGFQGIIIIDLTDYYNPVIQGQVIVTGWVINLQLVYNENFLIVSEDEKGQLAIINIQDPKNPYVQQLQSFPNEYSLSLCTSPDESFVYFTGNMGTRSMPLSSSLKIHTQIQVTLIDTNGQTYFQNIEPGQNLLVGQSATVMFVPLYTQIGVKITDVKYYRQFEIQTLPSWITFLQKQQQISMSVDKLGVLNNFSSDKKGENILILSVNTQLQESDFALNSSFPDLAHAVYTTLVREGYIDNLGYLSSKLDPTIDFALDFYNNSTLSFDKFSSIQIQQIQTQIKKRLVFSQIQYPIRFFVVLSLFFHNYPQNYLQPIIETPSSQVSILLTILKNGIFVKKALEGVLASFSDDQTSLKISGQTSFVNSILSSALQISTNSTEPSDVTFYIDISDSVNFDVVGNYKLTDLPFITIVTPVQVDQKNTLSMQFEKYFSGSSVSVEERFSISFDMNTFYQKDKLALTYKAYQVISDDNVVQITSVNWIEFNDFSLTISGMRSGSYWQTRSKVRIVATDGYSSAKDEFTIYFGSLPFFYVFSLIIQIAGPIIGILDGITNEVLKIWDLLLKKKKFIKKEILNEYKLTQKINVSQLVQSMQQIYQQNQKDFKNIDPREFDFDDSRTFRICKKLAISIVLNNDRATQKVINELIKIAKSSYGKNDWYKHYLDIIPVMKIKNNQIFRKIVKPQNSINLQQQRLVQARLKQLGETQRVISSEVCLQENVTVKEKDTPQNAFSQQLAKLEDVKLNVQQQDDAKMKISSSQHSQEKTEDLLQDKEARFDLQKSTELEEIDFQGYHNLNPFPEMVIKESILLEAIQKVKCQQHFDINLIVEWIILEASGVLIKSPNALNPSVAESLHVFPHQLLSLQAFRKDQTQLFGCILNCLNLNYTPIGLTKNNPLPKWLQHQVVDGIIHLWGTPQVNDDAEILIRIIDQNQITIRSFHILIQDGEGNDLRDKNFLREANQKINKTREQMKITNKVITSQIALNSQTNNELLKLTGRNQNIESNSQIEDKRNFEQNFRQNFQNKLSHFKIKSQDQNSIQKIENKYEEASINLQLDEEQRPPKISKQFQGESETIIESQVLKDMNERADDIENQDHEIKIQQYFNLKRNGN